LNACSQTVGTVPAVSPADISANAVTSPKITNVTRIGAKKIQKIVISGSGFGNLKPYTGDSLYIKVQDNTAKWNAGHKSAVEYDGVTLHVTSWNTGSIVIAGFAGAYGQNGWYLSKGDSLTVKVWNAQSAKGPAVWHETVF
jgi:hypothetical protein